MHLRNWNTLVVLLLGILSSSKSEECWADGGMVEERQPCSIPFLYQAITDVHGIDVRTSKTFLKCAPIGSQYRPVGISIHANGTFKSSTTALFDPIHDDTNVEYWCPVGENVYSDSDNSLQPKWGYCSCGGSHTFPSRAPTPTGKPSMHPSAIPTVEPTQTPTTSPSTMAPTKSPTTATPTAAPIPACKTNGGFAKGNDCVFPFTVGGVEYRSCIEFSDPSNPWPYMNNVPSMPQDYQTKSAWCATVPTYDASRTLLRKSWGTCGCYSVAPTVAPSQAPVTPQPTQSPIPTCPINGGFQLGSACRFPFYINGVEYRECLEFANSSNPTPYMKGVQNMPSNYKTKSAWCPTVTRYDKKLKYKRTSWGTCGCYTPRPTQAPTVKCNFDGVLNSDETDIDCGGVSCPSCSKGSKCKDSLDCQGALLCADGVCKNSTTLFLIETIDVPVETGLHKFIINENLESIFKKFVSDTFNAVMAGVMSMKTIDLLMITDDDIEVPSCHTDGGWSKNGSRCELPFKLNNVTHYECVDVADHTPYWGNDTTPPHDVPLFLYGVKWCPTVQSYSNDDLDVREKWGFCDCGDSWPTIAPTPRPTNTHFPTRAPVVGPPTIPQWCEDRKRVENETNLLLKSLRAHSDLIFNVGSGFSPARRLEEVTNNWMLFQVTAEIDPLHLTYETKTSVFTLAQQGMLEVLSTRFENKTVLPSECTHAPTNVPTIAPSRGAIHPSSTSTVPTSTPTVHIPSVAPTMSPTTKAKTPTSIAPSLSPTTLSPTIAGETWRPTTNPTTSPTSQPSQSPSMHPTESPTVYTPAPSVDPSRAPTSFPTVSPNTPQPTNIPTQTPTSDPSVKPTKSPTPPTASPTMSPTVLSRFVQKYLNSVPAVQKNTHVPACLERLEVDVGATMLTSDIDLCTRDKTNCACMEKLMGKGAKLGVLCLDLIRQIIVSPHVQHCQWGG